MSEVTDYWKPELEKSESLVRAQGHSIASMASQITALQSDLRTLAEAVVALSDANERQTSGGASVQLSAACGYHAPAITLAQGILEEK